jgi:hypothetical protein
VREDGAVKKLLIALAITSTLACATTTTHAMSVVTNATGPYNYTCDDFAKAKPRGSALFVFGFIQGCSSWSGEILLRRRKDCFDCVSCLTRLATFKLTKV